MADPFTGSRVDGLPLVYRFALVLMADAFTGSRVDGLPLVQALPVDGLPLVYRPPWC